MSVRAPRPDVTKAFLISDGINEPTPTLHHYYETRATTLPGPHGAAWEHVFKCFKTGALRRWGTEPRLEIGGEELN